MLVFLDVHNCCSSGSSLYPRLYRFFMEKQVMGEFVRILKLSKINSVPLQLLQTVSILVQNLRNEHAICRLIIIWNFLFGNLLLSLVSQLRCNSVDGLIIFFVDFFADYVFSNEHINYLITYSFDFKNEELLSHYISFLRFVLKFFYLTGQWW